MDEITLQQMKDYLSSLVDKLSAISSEAYCIKKVAGHKVAHTMQELWWNKPLMDFFSPTVG